MGNEQGIGEQLLEALQRIGDELNLVPGKLRHAQQFSYVAGTALRIEKKLGRSGGAARAYAVIIKNRETIDGTDTVLEFLMNAGTGKAKAYERLQGGAGMYITPGASFEMAVAEALPEFTLDVKGTQKSDFATDRAVVGRVWIYELVPATHVKEKGSC